MRSPFSAAIDYEPTPEISRDTILSVEDSERGFIVECASTSFGGTPGLQINLFLKGIAVKLPFYLYPFLRCGNCSQSSCSETACQSSYSHQIRRFIGISTAVKASFLFNPIGVKMCISVARHHLSLCTLLEETSGRRENPSVLSFFDVTIAIRFERPNQRAAGSSMVWILQVPNPVQKE